MGARSAEGRDRCIAILAGTPPGDRIEGLGELAPFACDDSDTGLSKNRRVEIWTF